MRLFHLSDLHIGKQLYGYSLLEDQQWILGKVVELVKERKPDAVILAGDIYDKSVPSAEAVSVFDSFLSQLASLEPKVMIMIISGNHDSPERLSYAKEILKNQGIYLAGMVPSVQEERLCKVTLTDEWGQIDVRLLPYCRPGDVSKLSDKRMETHQEAVEFLLGQETLDLNRRNILVSHQFYVSGTKQPKTSDSELLIIGGLDQVDIACLEPFEYVALGHIHRPQSIGRDCIRYCGTMLKYSVSEWNQEKSITEVELGPKGTNPKITLHPVEALRDVCVIRGELEDIIANADPAGCDDYVSILLTDKQEPYLPKERLEMIFSRILEVKMDHTELGMTDWIEAEELISSDPRTIFEDFFEKMQGRHMDKEEQAVLEDVFLQVGEKIE